MPDRIFLVKGTDQEQPNKETSGEAWEDSKGRTLMSPWGQGAPPSLYFTVFSTQKLPPSFGVQSLYWGFTTQA